MYIQHIMVTKKHKLHKQTKYVMDIIFLSTSNTNEVNYNFKHVYDDTSHYLPKNINLISW